MTNASDRYQRGFAVLGRPGQTIDEVRKFYDARLGHALSVRLVRCASLTILGAWIMLVALAVMIVGGVVTLLVMHSLSYTFAVMLGLFLLIIAGFVVQQVGVQGRQSTLRAVAIKYMIGETQLSVGRAIEILKSQPRLDQWMSRHPHVLPPDSRTA
jgi:hypothetical protein